MMTEDHALLDAEVEQFESEARRIAAGGWRRAAIGFGIGAAAGLAAALVMPRNEGPRRGLNVPNRPFMTHAGASEWDARSAR